jgi:hypothetical protein
MHCTHCGNEARETYRAKGKAQPICDGCLDAKVGVEIERCEECSRWFAEGLISACESEGRTFCLPCHETANADATCGCFVSLDDDTGHEDRERGERGYL